MMSTEKNNKLKTNLENKIFNIDPRALSNNNPDFLIPKFHLFLNKANKN